MAHIWIIVISAILGIGLFGLYVYAWSIPTLQWFAPAILRGPAQGNRIALTFDDGPSPGYTRQVLEVLKGHEVKATFFVCGRNVERYPEILRQVQAEGHSIGNHGYSHPFPFFHRRVFFQREIELTQKVIERVTGNRPRFFRPPFGARWLGLTPAVEQCGLRLVNWSDTGYDWELEREGIIRETLKGLGPGSIILLHDGRRTYSPNKVDRSATVAALPAIIDAARQAGFTFVTLEELL